MTAWPPAIASAMCNTSAGRSLAAGQGFSGNHGASPGLPILVAASYMIFGEALWPINLLLSAMGFATAVLTYRIVRFDRSRRTALNVFLLTGLSVALYVHSLSIESDVPALFCLTAALWSLQKFTRGGWRWLPVAGMVCGVRCGRGCGPGGRGTVT